MKFTTVFSLLALTAATVGAVEFETNASRLARGLPPRPPVRRSRTHGELVTISVGDQELKFFP